MAINKSLQVFIPVVTSEVVQNNGLTPYINFFVERLYLANNLNTFVKFAGVKDTTKFASAAMAILGAIALGIKVYKDYLDINLKKNQLKNKSKNVSSSTQYNNDVINFSEDIKLTLDKPTQVQIEDTIIIFRAMNFVTNEDIDKFRQNANDIKGWFSKIVAKYFKQSVSIVTKEVFYCYSIEEVNEDQLKQKLRDPKNAICLVDTVNDLVTVYMRVKNVITKNTVRISKLTGDRKKLGNDSNLEDIIRSLKSVQVSRV